GGSPSRRHISNSATLLALCGPPHKASKGTKDCARRAIAAGIPTYLIDSGRAEPGRVKLGGGTLRGWSPFGACCLHYRLRRTRRQHVWPRGNYQPEYGLTHER